MTIKELDQELKKLRELVRPEDWERFLETEVPVYINGQNNIKEVRLSGLCGGFLEFGVLPLIEIITK